jgi:hypothetical protein
MWVERSSSASAPAWRIAANAPVMQQDVIGTSSTTGPFVLPNLVVLTVSGGEIQHLRDFVNIPAAFAAMGHDP